MEYAIRTDHLRVTRHLNEMVNTKEEYERVRQRPPETLDLYQRAAQLISEDMQYMGPVRVSDVEQAQQKIVDIVRRLEDAGEIIIAGRGGEKEMVV